jgi:hypothetical protein
MRIGGIPMEFSLYKHPNPNIRMYGCEKGFWQFVIVHDVGTTDYWATYKDGRNQEPGNTIAFKPLLPDLKLEIGIEKIPKEYIFTNRYSAETACRIKYRELIAR